MCPCISGSSCGQTNCFKVFVMGSIYLSTVLMEGGGFVTEHLHNSQLNAFHLLWMRASGGGLKGGGSDGGCAVL